MCKYTKCHSQCPNYIPPKAALYCSICGQGIYCGEDYIENDNGEFRHYDCIYGIHNLLEWLGCEIKTMEDDYEENY